MPLVTALSIASGASLHSLESEINRLIAAGYQPSPGANIRPDGNGFLGFAMEQRPGSASGVAAVKLACARYLPELQERVAALINDGWQPFASAGIQADNDGFIALPMYQGFIPGGGAVGSALRWVSVVVDHAALADAGAVVVVAGDAERRYLVRDIILVGGTSFSSGGDRLLSLTDGTSVYTTVPNASLEATPAVSQRWGSTAVPFVAGTAATPTVAGQDLRFSYSGGSTDHDAGALTFVVCVEEVGAL